MSLILQTEAALADAVAAEAAAAAEFAEANSLFLESIARREAAASTVKRIRSALDALQGLGAVSAPAESPPEQTPVAAEIAPKPKKQKSGVQCPSCGDVGTLNQYAGYKGSTKTVTVCSGCSAEFVS